MKNTTIIFLTIATVAIVVGLVPARAQKVEFPLTVKNITPIKTSEFLFIVSAHPNGSDTVDKNLDEIEIPSLPLPGDQFYVWTIAPTEEPIWLSPKEVRKLIKGEKHLVVYDLRVNWNGGTLEILWNYPIPMYIDSMVVVDGLSTYPNNILSAKVGPGTKITTNNPAFDRFNVMIWYNASSLDVVENTSAADLRVWPTPAGNMINVECELLSDASLQILDVQGAMVFSAQLLDKRIAIDLSSLPSGLYALRLLHASGAVTTSLFVHY